MPFSGEGGRLLSERIAVAGWWRGGLWPGGISTLPVATTVNESGEAAVGDESSAEGETGCCC